MRRELRREGTVLALALFLGTMVCSSCGGSLECRDGPDPVVGNFSPHCSPSCVARPEDHWWSRPDAGADNQHNLLFLFLPGTNATAMKSRNIIEAASRVGFHAISLSFDNTREEEGCKHGEDVGTLMDLQATTNCFAEFRHRAVTGLAGVYFDVADLDSGWSGSMLLVDVDDTVTMRLQQALILLRDNNDVGQGWDQFLDGTGVPDWSKIAVAGWSMGAGMSRHIAHLYPVWAVGLIEFPKDPFTTDNFATGATVAPPDYGGATGATAACQYWAMYHESDQPDQKREWLNAIGVLESPDEVGFLIDDPTDATTSNTGAEGDHRFQTEHTCPDVHKSLTQDAFMRQDSGPSCVSSPGFPTTDYFHYEALRFFLCRLAQLGNDPNCQYVWNQ